MIRAVGVLLMVSACSFFTMRSPRGTPPECEESRVSPLVDTAVTIATPFVAYAILASNNSNPPKLGETTAFEGIAAVLITTPVTLVTGASAIYGFVKADRCERAKRDYQQLIGAPPPRPLPPPWPQPPPPS